MRTAKHPVGTTRAGPTHTRRQFDWRRGQRPPDSVRPLGGTIGLVDELASLAEMLRKRDEIDRSIAALIGRPAERGHLGEYIASRLFGIRLAESATHPALDGWFVGGALDGSSVNIKWYGADEGILDLREPGTVDYYLVITGPRRGPGSSRRTTRPFVIDQVFIFRSDDMHAALAARGIKIGTATSVVRRLWDAAKIYPDAHSPLLTLSKATCRQLAAFATSEPRASPPG